MWVFFGHFNAVRKKEERLNSIFYKYTAADFNGFIVYNGLKEFNMGGMKFTFLRDDGQKLSKIDRFLVCQNFICNQSSTSVTALPRLHSDHSPIILMPLNLDFGPSPFRMFNSWLLSDDFNASFLAAWESFTGYGTPDRLLKAMLIHTKNKIKEWKKQHVSKESDLANKLKHEVEEMGYIAETRTLTEAERTQWRENKLKLLELEHKAKLDIKP